MKVKKILTTIIACVLALTTLAACSKNDSDSTNPAEWERDVNEHWQVSEKGKKIKASDHTIKDSACSVCGSEICTYDDGSADIYNYNEYGEFLRLTSYDADGNIVHDTNYEYEYDENGNMILQQQYESGVLIAESEYYVNFEGDSTLSKQTFYSDDGTRSVSECDGNGNVIKELFYDANGNETVTTEYAYTYTTDVDFFLSTKIEYFDDGTKFIIDYNEYGDTMRWYTFDAYGNVTSDIRYEYTYDSEGNMISSTEYEDSWLASEYEYALDADGYSYCSKEIVYNEDDSTTHYEYDENGEIIKETTYDYSGNVIG